MSEDQPMIVMFVSETSPVIYFGEAVSVNSPSSENTADLYLKNALVAVLGKEGLTFNKPIGCSKKSILHLRTDSLPGFTIYDPEEGLLKEYQKSLIQVYSNLVLA